MATAARDRPSDVSGTQPGTRRATGLRHRHASSFWAIAAIVAELPTLEGWFPVTAAMAAVMSFAVPSIACATALFGSDRSAAIWLRDSPCSTCGEKLEPVMR